MDGLLEPITIADLLTVGGNAAVTALLVEFAIKRPLALTEQTVKRFIPLVAIGIGIALAEFAAFLLGDDWAQAALTGGLAGAASIGLYDALGPWLGRFVENITGGRLT